MSIITTVRRTLNHKLKRQAFRTDMRALTPGGTDTARSLMNVADRLWVPPAPYKDKRFIAAFAEMNASVWHGYEPPSTHNDMEP